MGKKRKLCSVCGKALEHCPHRGRRKPSMTEREYSDAFAKYLRMAGPPLPEQVPPVPPDIDPERARELRWEVYEKVKRDESERLVMAGRSG